MNIYKLIQMCLAGLFFLMVNNAIADSWPKMPFPKDASVGVVSENMVFNGVPMRTWTVDSKKSLAEVVDFYRAQWKNSEDPLYDERVIGNWTYINFQQNGFLLSAKLQSLLGKTQGYMGMSHVENQAEGFVLGKNFPLPRGASVVNDITESDPGKRHRFLLFNSDQNVRSTYEFYLKHFSKKGWSALSTNMDPAQTMASIAMDKAGDELNISIMAAGLRSEVTVNLVNKTLF